MTSTIRAVALVTGGRRGIGRGVALALARQGFDVAFTDVVEDAEVQSTHEQLQALGAKSLFIRHDVSDVDSHDALIARVNAELGSICCLVNNAGISVKTRGDILNTTTESFDALLTTNLRGPFFLTQRVAAHFMQTPAVSQYRSIVNVSSANAFAASLNRAE